MVYAIAPAQNQVLWIDRVREPFLAPTILKASVVGMEGELLKLNRITKPVDRSQVYEINENKYRDIEKARTEFSDALEELERLVKNCKCIANHRNESFVDRWAIALKHHPDRRVELEPWEILTIRMGKIRSHSSEEVKLTDLEENKFRCGEPERVYVLKSLSDWQLIQSQIELCEKMGQQFKNALETRLSLQNVLEFKKPGAMVLRSQPQIEASEVVEGEIIESISRTEEEQKFYNSLDPKVRDWLVNDAEPTIFSLEHQQAQFEQQAMNCEIQRGKLLIEVRKRLGDRDGSWGKWLELCYQEQVRSKSLKSAMERARTAMRLAESQEFTSLPQEVLQKFDPSAAKLLIKQENEDARKKAIAIAQDPETKILSFRKAKELVWEQDPETSKPERKKKEKPQVDNVNRFQTLNPPPLESEEEYPYEAIRNGTNEEIKDLIDSLIHQKLVAALEDEGRKIHWEEIAKREAEEEVNEKLEKYSEAIAELAKTKSKNVQLQQRIEELEAKLAQVNESEIVKENQELHRKVNEYAIAHRAKQQVSTKYHFVEQTAQVLFNKGDQLNTFRELLAALKAAEEELLILKGASAAVEKSPQSVPAGDATTAETSPEKIAIGT